ncbi:hypothetical protein LTR36_009114 [Oleoguttula mirabilis]|uniref:Mitochondrial ATPase complex subunit ATP10 n=1 Tax=Oleoguttula mirabilis TaxID=1507867 RepID=A0AAV9J763_9PEZI|nr:hypothetical protein LTR36_009114 [Oleoguttula mirabilis]
MKAPSPLCLQALRAIAFPPLNPQCRTASRRCYAALPDQPPTRPPPPPQNYTKAKPPPPPTATATTTTQPTPFRPTPSGPSLRKKQDDDEDFTPYPLSRPIGMPNPPQPGENMGLDKRTLRQRRDDFHNYEKHLERRARMTRQIAKPYFRDWSNMRFHKGKGWVANERLFRGEHALWFPNFFGKPLRKQKGLVRGGGRLGRRDGYGGLGKDTCTVMEGKVSVVSLVSNTWAENQVETFCSRASNPALHEVLAENKEIAQRVEINYESNILKWYLLQLFAGRSLRRTRSLEEQGRYFMVRRGLSELMKEAIGVLNDKGGYVYLVDGEGKIRWAGSAEAGEGEKESLVRGVRRLVQEARMPREARGRYIEEKEELEAVVMDVTDDVAVPEKAAATAAG